MRNTNLNILAATVFSMSALVILPEVRASEPAPAVDTTTQESAVGSASTGEFDPTVLRDQHGRADLDGNGEITVFDLALMLGHWGYCPLRSSDPCEGDINADGAVDEADLGLMLSFIGLRAVPVIDFPYEIK